MPAPISSNRKQPLTVQVTGVLSAIAIGVLVGALGRFVVPGRQSIGILLTVVLGLAGSFAGGYLASRFTSSFLPVLITQVVVAALLIALFAVATRGSNRT